MSVPTTTKGWKVNGQGSFDNLNYQESIKLDAIGDLDVLVKFHAASLNFRDLIIPLGKYPFPIKDGVTPGSDGAGEVVAIGSRVSRFKKGDKVVTLFNQGHLGGSLDHASLATGLGGVLDGTLREYGSFNENGLVLMPPSLSYTEAATLPCAALTAWNALFGLKPVTAGDTVVTQGTGGVSIFALQFAKAAGATVIATTSSAEKAKKLKELGADHVINYKETPEWGVKAKELSYRGQGAQHVVEVAGNVTMAQSLKAVKIDGVISIIGFVGGNGDEKAPQFLECLTNMCIVRGILVGSRIQLEEMNAAIEANKIKPVVDAKIFKLEELKEAYQYQLEQKHFGKIVVAIQ